MPELFPMSPKTSAQDKSLNALKKSLSDAVLLYEVAYESSLPPQMCGIFNNIDIYRQLKDEVIDLNDLRGEIEKQKSLQDVLRIANQLLDSESTALGFCVAIGLLKYFRQSVPPLKDKPISELHDLASKPQNRALIALAKTKVHDLLVQHRSGHRPSR